MIHVFNKITHFLHFWTAQSDDFLWVSNHKVSIQSYNNVNIEIQSSINNKLMRLHNVVFYKNFTVNLMSLHQFYKLSYWWDNRSEFNHIHKINQNYIIIIILMKLHEQNVLKYIFIDYNYIKTIFFNQQNYFNSWTEWKSVITDVWIWHLKLEHVRSQSFQHLIICFKNVWIQKKLKNLITINCNNCAIAKISWKIHHEFRFNEKNSEKYLAINFHDFK